MHNQVQGPSLLSGHRVSKHSVILTVVVVTALLEYFV